MAAMIVPVYLAEVSPNTIRGKIGFFLLETNYYNFSHI